MISCNELSITLSTLWERLLSTGATHAGRIYNQCLWVQVSTTYSSSIEVAQWAAPSCRRPQPATANSVRVGRSN